MSEKTRLSSRKFLYTVISVEISIYSLIATIAALFAIAASTFISDALGSGVTAVTSPLGHLLRYSVPEAPKTFIIHAHRGGAGMRAESTIYAFAYGIDVGADAIEMDVLFTKDGIRIPEVSDRNGDRLISPDQPVIWHDFTIDADKCTETVPGSGYLGKYVNELTLAELKTLDCGSQQSENHIQAQTFPGAQIHTLSEVLTFVSCYDTTSSIDINLETKIEPRQPNITLPLSHYLTYLVPVITSHNMAHRTIIQSFDWRTLSIKHLFPSLPLRTTANIDETMLEYIETTFGGDWLSVAKRLGADAVSPIHGSPNGNGDWTWTVNTRDYVPMTTRSVVERAHELGMKVVPWTVDDESTVEKLINEGVDGLISNYPMRIAFMANAMGLRHNLNPNWRVPEERKKKFEECMMRIATMPPTSGIVPADVSPQAQL